MSDSDYVPEDALRAALSACSVQLPSPNTTPVAPQARSVAAPPPEGAASNDDDEGTELCDFIQSVADASSARIIEAILPAIKGLESRFDALDKRTRQITEDFVRLNVAVSDMARCLEDVISVVDSIEGSLCEENSDDEDGVAATPSTAWAAPLTPHARTPASPQKNASAAASPAATPQKNASAAASPVASPQKNASAAASPAATPPAAAATSPAATPASPPSPAATTLTPTTPSTTLVGAIHALDDDSIKGILAAANTTPATPPSTASSTPSEHSTPEFADVTAPITVLGVAYESGAAALEVLARMKLSELKQAYASLGGTKKARTKAAIASAIVEHCYQHQQ